MGVESDKWLSEVLELRIDLMVWVALLVMKDQSVYEVLGHMCQSLEGSALKLLQTTRLLRRESSVWRNFFRDLFLIDKYSLMGYLAGD